MSSPDDYHDREEPTLEEECDYWVDLAQEREKEITSLKSQLEQAQECLKFFQCVIKCGEPWTDECQKQFDAALERSKE
jgi:hypothetical protein